MDNIKNIITGGIITLVVGGAAFTFSQQDVIDNFAADTGLTQEQAEQYVNNVSEDELTSFDTIGAEYIKEGEETLKLANSIDCATYEYEWESATLPCNLGKAQLKKTGDTERLLGQAYVKLASDNASEEDMRTAIRYLDKLNLNYALEASVTMFDTQVLNDIKMTNSYNKSILTAALESN